MPPYRYTVVNPENKELAGTINSPDEKSARFELNQLGFSIISIAETSTREEPQAQTQSPLFEFSAIDKNKKRVVGTIRAEDLFSAYKRLIQEYLFEVQYLVDAGLPEEQKIAEKQKGIFELQNRIDTEERLEKKKKMGSDADIKEFESKQAMLQQQVNFVLQKVGEMLDQYDTEIKPDTKEKIHHYVDKILRIKNSTNLDYIRNTCGELLTYLQKEEMFLHEDLRLKERTKMALEAKSMMMQLHRSRVKPDLGIKESLAQWRNQHILQNDRPNFYERFIDFLIGCVIGFTPESPEIQETRRNLGIINQQIKQYLLLYFQAPSQEFKAEAKIGFKRLLQERKKLVLLLKTALRQAKNAAAAGKQSAGWKNAGRYFYNFSGWLLVFYLCYYFASLYLRNKNFGIAPLPQNLDILHSSFLKYFLAILFLFHAAISLKINFFRGSKAATMLLTPLFFLGSIMIILNF